MAVRKANSFGPDDGFAELLGAADYVVLTNPLTPETRGLIGRAELGRMKPTAVLVNVARGPVVDADALTEALTERRIFAAALDVTDPEPLPRDHPLLKLDNVIVTPHLGSASEPTRRRMAEMSADNLLSGLAGRPLPVAPARRRPYFIPRIVPMPGRGGRRGGRGRRV